MRGRQRGAQAKGVGIRGILCGAGCCAVRTGPKGRGCEPAANGDCLPVSSAAAWGLSIETAADCGGESGGQHGAVCAHGVFSAPSVAENPSFVAMLAAGGSDDFERGAGAVDGPGGQLRCG